MPLNKAHVQVAFSGLSAFLITIVGSSMLVP